MKTLSDTIPYVLIVLIIAIFAYIKFISFDTFTTDLLILYFIGLYKIDCYEKDI